MEIIKATYEELGQLFLKAKLSPDQVIHNSELRSDLMPLTLDVTADSWTLLMLIAREEQSFLRGKRKVHGHEYVSITVGRDIFRRLEDHFRSKALPVPSPLITLREQDHCYRLTGFDWYFLPWENGRFLTLMLFPVNAPLDEVLKVFKENKSVFLVPETVIAFQRDHHPVHILEYDWILSTDYVGPDRRAEPDGEFWNSYVLMGRRKEVVRSTQNRHLIFTDRLSGRMLLLLAIYFVLISSDTILSIRFITFGTYREINPLLKDWVESAQLLKFVIIKNLLSIGLFLFTARFERSRTGLFFTYLNLLIYLVINIYWAWLLL